jgi:hypothetical protein
MSWAITVGFASHKLLKVVTHTDEDSLLDQILVRLPDLFPSPPEYFLVKSNLSENPVVSV